MAPVRQQMWNNAIRTLREIDPKNPNLTAVSTGDAPSQAALDRLDAAITTAEIERVKGILMPGGVPIGDEGSDPSTRELPGGLEAAQKMFSDLSVGGRLYLSMPDVTVVKLPGDTGFVTFPPVSKSGPPAVDINVQGLDVEKLHFP